MVVVTGRPGGTLRIAATLVALIAAIELGARAAEQDGACESQDEQE